MLSSIYLLACWTWKRKASPIEWGKYSLSVSLSFSTVQSCHRSTSTKRRWTKLKRVWKCATKWSMTCSNSASSTFRGRKSTIPTRMRLRRESRKAPISKLLMSTAADLRKKGILEAQAEIDPLAAFWVSKKPIMGLIVLTYRISEAPPREMEDSKV